METAEIKTKVNEGIQAALSQIMSGKTPELAKAFVSFWADAGEGVAKNANNPHFKNDYADLSACLAVVKPALVKNGLALVQAPGSVRDGNQQLHSVLVHSSGQSWTFLTELPLGGKATAQSAGSCLTYARRYFLLALAGIAPVDDDGNGASEAPDTRPATAHNPNELSTLILEMIAFEPTKGEKPKDTVARYTKEFKARVSATGDQHLVNKYLAQRLSLKSGN